SLKNKSAREGQKELLKLQPKAINPKDFEKERPLTPEASEVRFLMSDKLRDKLEKVRALLGTKAIGMGYGELIETMADLSAERLTERRFGKGRVVAHRETFCKKAEVRSKETALRRDLFQGRRQLRIRRQRRIRWIRECR